MHICFGLFQIFQRIRSIIKLLTIVSRASNLAVWQAEYVRKALLIFYPECEINILKIHTQADKFLDSSLVKIGGKGLFVKELEIAMANGQADLAVHSLKDVPMILRKEFTLAAVLEREVALDAFVAPAARAFTLKDLSDNSIIGTSSLRREAILRSRFPRLKIKTLRGNVITRLDKLDAGEHDGIILAAAGLKRLGLEHRITQLLSAEESLPAVGQGALAIETLSSYTDLIAKLKILQHTPTKLAVSAERSLARTLGSNCHHPVAAYAVWHQKKFEVLCLRAMVAMPDGSMQIYDELTDVVKDIDSAEMLGSKLANRLLEKGAMTILGSLTA